MDTRGISGRLEKLERISRQTLPMATVDSKALLIERINRVVERARITPTQADVDPATVLETLREYIRRKHGV
jgi:hypothetical protein